MESEDIYPYQEKRLEAITLSLFLFSFRRVSRGLLQKDEMSFALRLAQVKLSESKETQKLDYNELQFLLKVQPTAYGRGAPELPKALN
eukprot:1352079-Amorphochlora_amoeboformis.AAC.1